MNEWKKTRSLKLDATEYPILIAALLNHIDRLPEPRRTVALALHRRMLADYHANFDWKSGIVGPSYIAAALRDR